MKVEDPELNRRQFRFGFLPALGSRIEEAELSIITSVPAHHVLFVQMTIVRPLDKFCY